MSLVRALFVPNGVVDQRTYWIGAAILVAAGAAITALPLLFLSEDGGFSQMMFAATFGSLLYLMIYPWFCLIAGRLRDVGSSPWFYLAGLVGYVVLAQIIGFFVMMPEMMSMMGSMAENMPSSSDDPAETFKAMQEQQAELMRRVLPKQVIGSTIASILAAMPFGFLKNETATEDAADLS